MPCLRKVTLVKLLFNVTCFTAKSFFFFIYHISLFLAKLLSFIFRSQHEYEDDLIYEEDEMMPELEDDDEREYPYSYVNVEGDHHIHIKKGGQALHFHHYPKELPHDDDYNNKNNKPSISRSNSDDSLFEDPVEAFDELYMSAVDNDVCHHHEVIFNGEDSASSFDSMQSFKSIQVENTNTNTKTNHSHQNSPAVSSVHVDHDELLNEYGSHLNYSNNDHGEKKIMDTTGNFTNDGKFLIFAPPKSEARKIQEKEMILEDTYSTVGSSSSDWRSSIRDSGTDDPFSSSSRRSCPKWESYAVYQKYDEEMAFLDRISAQKLHETESLKSLFQVKPRSVSYRIVHKLGNKNKKKSGDDAAIIYSKNPYNELEAAYVGQICLAWETLNWNYANFKRKQESLEDDPGCPALVAQQFQQFQVLLQRYIETEPYERGKRPQIYTRIRSSVAPKLLQVPQYHDYEGEEQEAAGGRIASALFLQILEDAIHTFMNFLKADRQTHCQLITALFKQRPRTSIDLTVINVFKKHLKKKKLKIRELQGSGICFRKRKLAKAEEMEIVMGLIDLKVVSRVLRMADITQEQLHWCEAKMDKLRLLDGKLQRDSSPLFFPAH